MTRIFRLICFLIVLALLPQGAAAQTSTTPAPPKTEAQEKLDASVQALSDKLADIESRADVTHLNQAALEKVATELAPLVVEAQGIVERLTPRVAALKARLDEMGPKPDKGESAETAKEREALEKAFHDNDGLFKRAKVLVVKAQQGVDYAAKRQRALFENSLFQRSTSILSPPLWATVFKETPQNVTDIARIARAWLTGLNQGLTDSQRIAFWAVICAVILAFWPLKWLAKRFVRHDPQVEHPTNWQKALLACWTAVSIIGLMIAVAFGVVYVFSFFAPADSRLAPLFDAMQWSVVRIAVAIGLARGLLSSDRAHWRFFTIDDTTVGKLFRIVVGVAVIVSATRVIEALNEVIGASYQFTVAVRGIGTLITAGALAAALFDLRDDPDADAAAPASSPHSDLYSLLRGVAWTLIVVMSAAAVIGYIALGNFLTDQLILLAATGAVVFLLIRLIDEACEIGFQPNSRLGRNLIFTVGMRRERLQQIPVLLAGGARLLLFFLALPLLASSWGMQSSDLSNNLDAIFFGFKVGDVTISLSGIGIAILSFAIVLAITHAIQNWLEDRYLPTTRLDSGLRNSIKTSLGYTGFILALALGAANLGVDFQKIAIVAGALSVGIGFGLQSIVNNFVSGLILLWERAVRVGDWVVVGSDQGYVRKINVRSTEIETFDRAAVIVPNSNLVSGVVKNLMRTDRVGRLVIDLTVHASADPEKVREVLLDIARENDDIVSLPSPQVRFTDLTATAMSFSLFCFVADVESMARTKSDLYFEIYRQFRQHKFFEGPAPDPTRIDIEGLDRLEALLKPVNQVAEPPVRPRKTG